MSFFRPHLIAIGLLCTLPGALLKAQNAQPSAAEVKLRESLRATMLQLRTSENDKAVLQAAKDEADANVKTLTDKVDVVTKQMAKDKTAADKATADLQGKIDERDKEIGALNLSLDQERAEHKKSVEFGLGKEAQRAKLEEQTIQLNRRVADQQTKNAAMFKIANEILSRYEKFGLGDALTAREPFTGITRVKLQSLSEEYQDKLADQRIKPAPAATPDPTATPAAVKTAKPKATPGKANEPHSKP
jgi:hypothetical protein